MMSKKGIRLLAAAGTLAIGAGTAHAQPSATAVPSQAAVAPGPEATSVPKDGVGDIVVTAERRSSTLQRTSIAASALTDADLEVRGVNTVLQLQAFTPSLSITETGLQRFINIRGVGTNASLPGVADGIVYSVDGVFVKSILNEIPFYDIERIEVLRGPQGTLSGQSATGGAINVLTKAPELGSTSGYAEASFANYKHATGEAAVNVPLSDTVAVRIATFGETRDSYFTALNPPGSTVSTPPAGHPGNLTRTAVRASVLFKPSDTLSITVRGEYYQRRSDGYVFKPVPGDPTVVFNGVNSVTAAPADPFTVNYDTTEKADLNVARVYADLRWDFADRFQLRSLTSYLTSTTDTIRDQDGNGSTPPLGLGTSNVRPFVTTQHIKVETVTQEFNLLTTGPGRLQGVLGAYYYYLPQPNSLTNANIALSLPVSTTKGAAVFGQATYAITDTLKLIGGLRYNSDRGNADQTVVNRANGAVTTTNPRFKSNALTGKASVEWQATQNQFVYGTVSRGYKAGGTNNPPLPTFSPEFVWNYEAGLKSSFFGNHFRTQVDVFYDTYKNFQAQVFDPSPLVNGQIVRNIGSATFYGLEFQGQAKFGGLSADVNASRIHSEFGKGPGGVDITAPDVRYAVGNALRGPITITGKRLPFAQNWTAAAGLEYRFVVGGGTLTPRVQYSYNGGQWSSIFEKSYDYIPSRGTVDLRLTYTRDRWSIIGFATNVGDKTYVTGKFGGFEYLGAPREFGLKTRIAF